MCCSRVVVLDLWVATPSGLLSDVYIMIHNYQDYSCKVTTKEYYGGGHHDIKDCVEMGRALLSRSGCYGGGAAMAITCACASPAHSEPDLLALQDLRKVFRSPVS